MAKKIYSNTNKIINMSEEQIKIIDDIELKSTWSIIDSTAGTGKTTTICSTISYLIDYYDIEPNEIMLITYTKNAHISMKYKLKLYTTQEIQYIGTIHSIAYQYIRKNLCDENNYYSPDEILTIFHRYVDSLCKKNKNNSSEQLIKLKYLFIDEYQDFDDRQLNIVNAIQKISNCKVLFFGDIDQSIYQFRNSVNTLETDYFHKFTKYYLTCNYRNPGKIIDIANSILKYKYTTFEHNNNFIKQIKQANFSYDADSTVKITGLCTLNEEIDYIINYLKSIDYTNKKILILSRYRFPLSILENKFVKNNINYNNLDDTKYIKYGKISISTIHSAKGLEADDVILINAGNIDMISEETHQQMIEEINLLFVAITRTKINLLITYHYKIHKILYNILADKTNIEHIEPVEIIIPKIYPKNNYISYGVVEYVKRLTLKDYDNIKQKYKISSKQIKVHPSLKELTNKSFLDIITFLNEKISGTLPMMGNYIDHYIGYVVNKKKSLYHPDLQHIKLIDYIGKDINIYRFMFSLDKNINDFATDIYHLNNNDLKNKYNETYKFTKMNDMKFDKMINIFKNIVDNGFGNNLLDFIQLNPMKMNLSPTIKKYLTFYKNLLNDNKETNLINKTIFVNSLLSAIIQGKTSYEHLISNIKRTMFDCQNEKLWFDAIEKYVVEAKYDVYQKTLHGKLLNGIIDLYSSETKIITDIKCSYSDFIPSQYVLQLLHYYILAQEVGLEVGNEHKLYLPILGKEIIYTFEKKDVTEI
jgi:hypothetical protein